MRHNRQVALPSQPNGLISALTIPPEGLTAHLRGYGWVRVFRTVSTDGAGEHWATNDLELSPEQRAELARQAWGIENYHRGRKQCCGVEKSPARSARAQWNHIRMALQAFLRLEVHRLRTGISWYQAKSDIIRAALRKYLANPAYLL